MKSDDAELLLQVAISISDRSGVDWEAAERDVARLESRELVRCLKALAAIEEAHRGSGPVEEPEAAPLPRRWGKLEIRQEIGSGAFGTVYCAWEETLGREVALKLLDSASLGPDASSRGGISHALEEGRRLARVRHPNVAAVYGAEEHAGSVGIWMELIQGRTLEALLKEQGPLGAREATNVGIELCRALAAVHGARLVHRDVKASNVRREAGGRIVLMDLGLGANLPREPEGMQDSLSGTPYYMAPEVLQGRGASKQSDLYGLGVLLYRLVTGAYPLTCTSLEELRGAHERRQMQTLHDARPDLPTAFVRVVEKALAHDPAERFSSAGLMERALAAAQGVEGPPPEPSWAERLARWLTARRIGLAIAGVVLGIGIGVWVTRTFQQRAAGARDNAAPASSSYTVDAVLYRRGDGGAMERLAPGAQVRPGDGLCLEFRASDVMYVYVIDEDERGVANLLFPLTGFDVQNPLAANSDHLIPGRRNGNLFTWGVSSTGNREHLLIVASREPEHELESDILALPQPGTKPGLQYAALSERSKRRLRGISTLREEPPATASSAATSHIYELVEKLAGPAEQARGIWIRRIDLENPADNERREPELGTRGAPQRPDGPGITPTK